MENNFYEQLFNSKSADYEEYFEFLDVLRESGVTNMFGAAPYLQAAFPHLAYDEARIILKAWMETFSLRRK